MTLDTVTRRGRKFVLVPLEEFAALPPVDSDGTSNAIDFARASIARRLVADRHAAGLSQQRLGKLAHVRQETISRIESGKQTATMQVINKLDKAIRRAGGKTNNRKAG
jgi:DNA-binding XRE family transcriptional regulator